MINTSKNIYRTRFLLGLAISLLGSACSQSEAPPGAQSGQLTDVSVVTYMEREPGTDTYPVRILVSPGHVRFDDGYDDSDYTLLDRRTRTLYSVSHESSSVLVIKNHPPGDTTTPADLSLTEERIVDNDAPTIAGKQPLQFNYLANGTLCYQTVSVAGIMDAAVAGMTEYATALGERQRGDLQTVPEELQTPCFLSRYAYAPERHYTHGLPLQIWDDAGYSSSLTDFQDNEMVSSALFEVPENYERIQLGQQ